MSRLLICALCDDVREEVGGKRTLVGLFDIFFVAEPTAPLPSFRIFVRFGVETPGRHSVVVRVAHEATGQKILEAPGGMVAETVNEASGLYETVFGLRVNGLLLPALGKYAVSILADGVDLGGCVFLATSMPPRTS